jgi:signal transduction histidine kinase
VTFERWRPWVVGGLGVVGAASLLYVFAVLTAVPSAAVPGAGLVWPLLGVMPLLGVGFWLATVSPSPLALVALGAGAAGAVSSGYEAYVASHPGIEATSTFPLVNGIGLSADALATICGVLVIGLFPDGRVEHRWQRWTLRSLWLMLLVAPLTLLVSPTVVVSQWIDVPAPPNPYAVESLAWATPLVRAIFVQPWFLVVLGVSVFYSRVLWSDPRTRARLRVMAFTIAAAAVSFTTWVVAGALGLPEGHPLMVLVQFLVMLAIVAVPVAYIHGVLQYGAFGVDPNERARLVIRSASLLITLLYAAAVATPALLLARRQGSVTVAIVLTVLMALALQPVRNQLEEQVRRRVTGDRTKQLAMLTSLGSQLERTAGLGDVLDQLATAVRDGLSASWVRLRLLDAQGGWAESPRGQAGEDGPSTAAPVTGHDLVRSGEVLGRIDLGPRRIGDYTPHELDLLATVARQATTAVANVRLTAQLEGQLAELSASRERLVAAQDEERRRIERDLHDGIQQDVVALIAGLRLARNRLGRGDLRPEELADLQDQAREMLADLREIAHGIHPPVLTDNGLYAAVESRAARFPLPLEVTAEESVRAERFTPDLETAAYYVVRESLANVAKHADARHARVRLSRKGNHLVIDVEDDGHGFDVGATNGHGGLANIRDRVSAVRGSVVVSSSEGSGTRVRAELPVGLTRAQEPQEVVHG